VSDLALDPLDIGARQIDLVDDRYDFEIVCHRQVRIGEGLGFNSLRGVYDQQRPLTGGQGSTDLVGEIHVARGVDQVQYVGTRFTRRLIVESNRMGFYRDSSLPFQIHAVQHLVFHLSGGQGIGGLEQAVGEGGFSVINVRNDREVTDSLWIHETAIRHRQLRFHCLPAGTLASHQVSYSSS
jgi:hypothetical protein